MTKRDSFPQSITARGGGGRESPDFFLRRPSPEKQRKPVGHLQALPAAKRFFHFKGTFVPSKDPAQPFPKELTNPHVLSRRYPGREMGRFHRFRWPVSRAAFLCPDQKTQFKSSPSYPHICKNHLPREAHRGIFLLVGVQAPLSQKAAEKFLRVGASAASHGPGSRKSVNIDGLMAIDTPRWQQLLLWASPG